MGVKSLLSLILLAGTYSCTTVPTFKPFVDNDSKESELSIVTIETPLCSRAVCKISNNDGDTYFMDTPRTINIRSSESDFEVTCFVEEVKVNKGSEYKKFQALGKMLCTNGGCVCFKSVYSDGDG